MLMSSRKEQSRQCLGRDFLTYLCYKSDDQAGAFEPEEPSQAFSLWLDGKIVLEDDRDVPPNSVAYSGDDFTNQDVKQAIRSGKKVREARFRIEKAENTWCFTLRADRLDVSGLKLDMPPSEDSDGQFFARIISIEALNDLIDALYKMFTAEFCSDTWKASGARRFQKWLQKS